MTQPNQLQRLEAHTSHLVNWVIEAHQTYSMVHPMLFDRSMTGRWSLGARTQGFLIIRNTLFQSCIQDVVGATLDGNKQTPSVKKICSTVNDAAVRASLRESYSNWVVQREPNEDPDIDAAITRMEAVRVSERQVEFDEHFARLSSLWGEFEKDSALAS